MACYPARMWKRRALIAAGLAGAAPAAYGFGLEPYWGPRVARYRLSPPGWPPGRSLRIAALADLHAGAPAMTLDRIATIVATTNALAPDIVVLLGDYGPTTPLIGPPYPHAEVCALLAGLRAPLGRYAVAGNHDWWEDEGAMARRGGPLLWMEALAQAGFTSLQNEALRLEPGFWLAGLDSQGAFLPLPWRPHRGADDLEATLAHVTDDAPVILLAHEPDIFAAGTRRVAVQLSGHTHGGQIRILGWSPHVPSRYGNRYAYGHVREGGRDLVVSGGLGTSTLPVRFGVPPEVVVVELARA